MGVLEALLLLLNEECAEGGASTLQEHWQLLQRQLFGLLLGRPLEGGAAAAPQPLPPLLEVEEGREGPGLPRRARALAALLFPLIPSSSLSLLAQALGAGADAGSAQQQPSPAPPQQGDLVAAGLAQLPPQLQHAWVDTLLQDVRGRVCRGLAAASSDSATGSSSSSSSVRAPLRPLLRLGAHGMRASQVPPLRAKPGAGLGGLAREALGVLRAVWEGGGALGALARGSKGSVRTLRDAAVACTQDARLAWEELAAEDAAAVAAPEEGGMEEGLCQQGIQLAVAAQALLRTLPEPTEARHDEL